MRITVLTLAVAILAAPVSAQEVQKGMVLQKLPSSLEAMLGVALDSNPDIQVADADLNHAHAKLKQVRLKVSHALVEAFQQRHLRLEALEIARTNYAGMKTRADDGLITRAELSGARQSLTATEVALTETESVIRALTGLNPTSGKTPEGLEEAMTTAFQYNGEVALAEADLVRMDARSNQVRLKVTEEVSITFQTRRSVLNALAVAEKNFQRMQAKVEKGLVHEEEKLVAFQGVIEAEGELVRIEAHLRYLLGLGSIRKKSESGADEMK
jgi:hypothetical protein